MAVADIYSFIANCRGLGKAIPGFARPIRYCWWGWRGNDSGVDLALIAPKSPVNFPLDVKNVIMLALVFELCLHGNTEV